MRWLIFLRWMEGHCLEPADKLKSFHRALKPAKKLIQKFDSEIDLLVSDF